MFKFVKYVLVSLLFVGSSVLASSSNNFASEKMGTVHLEIGTGHDTSYFGTGVIINEKLNIITNYHVVESVISGEDNLIKVCFTYDEKKEANCLGTASIEKYDEEKDLALLNTYIHPDYLNQNNIKSVYQEFKTHFNFVLNKTVKIADSIYVFGYPSVGGDTITYTSGKVSGFEDFYIKTDVKVNSGNSGGGAYNNYGELIGIVTAVSGGQGNIGWIVNASEIEIFLENTIFDKSTDSGVCGNHQYKTGRYDACKCEVGFKFDGMKKNCIPDLSSEGCGTLDSNSIFNPAAGTSCLCKEAYEWSFPDLESDYTCKESEIVEEKELVDGGACASGDNNYYRASTESCLCLDGFVWEDLGDENNLTCVEQEKVSCEDSYGLYAHENIENGLCYCEIGYIWNNIESPTSCVLVNKAYCEEGYRYSDLDEICVMNNISAESVFYDVLTSDINFAGIQYVKEHGYVNGYDDGSYKPGKKITRAEFTKIILLAEYSTSEIARTAHYNISDVHASDWYYDYVNFAKQQGVVNGYDDGSFRPNDEITFAEASKILVNTLIGYREIGYGEKWWLPFTNALIDRNVTQFDLSYSLTRGDMARLIYEILQ